MGENKNAMPILRKRKLKRRLLRCFVLFLILGVHAWKNRLHNDEDSFDDDDDGLMRKNANDDGKKSLRSRGRGDDDIDI